MQNFLCKGGPFDGSRLPCKFEPYEGAREVVYHFDGKMKVESFYELRRQRTIEPITGAGFWSWHFVSPSDGCTNGNTQISSPKDIWIAVGSTPQYGRVYLTDYAAIDRHSVGVKIMDRARAEGFRGTLDSRLEELGWEIVCVRLEEVTPSAQVVRRGAAGGASERTEG